MAGEPNNHMKTSFLLSLVTTLALPLAPSAWAAHPAPPAVAPTVFADSDDEHEEGPSEAVIRKLGAMMPEQKFTRGATTKSDGKYAPKDAPVYEVTITDAEGKSQLKLFFFKGDSSKWSVFDEAGNVMHET